MIDLHMHTKYSDGTDDVIGILKKAERFKLNTIAITDHETCAAHIELKNMDISKYFSGKVVQGTELKAFYKGKIIDILGYNIDVERMEKWLRDFYKDRTFEKVQTRYLEYYYKISKELGLKITPREELDWNPKKEWASVTFYREITSNEENKDKIPQDAWEDFNVFKFNYCYNPSTIFYIDKSQDHPSLEDTIKLIKDMGGKAFLAHAYIYKWAIDKAAFINDIVDNYGIDGIECYYSKFSDEQIDYVVNLCKEKNLFMSGGSDYHGENSKGIEMGIGKGNLKVPDEVLNAWL